MNYDRRLVHSDGPDTSKESLIAITASGRLDTQRKVVWDAIRRNPNRTAGELYVLLDQTYPLQTVRRRLHELHLDGYVFRAGKRVCPFTGTTCLTWTPEPNRTMVEDPVKFPPAN